jgi:hypothetical protein
MPMHVYWDDEAHTIIRTEGEGAWTWDEFHRTMDEVIRMMRMVNHRVDLINLRLPGAKTPEGSAMPHFQRAMRTMPANLGLNVQVSTSAFGRLMVALFTRLYGSRPGGRVVMVASLEEARAKIAEDRAKA